MTLNKQPVSSGRNKKTESSHKRLPVPECTRFPTAIRGAEVGKRVFNQEGYEVIPKHSSQRAGPDSAQLRCVREEHSSKQNKSRVYSTDDHLHDHLGYSENCPQYPENQLELDHQFHLKDQQKQKPNRTDREGKKPFGRKRRKAFERSRRVQNSTYTGRHSKGQHTPLDWGKPEEWCCRARNLQTLPVRETAARGRDPKTRARRYVKRDPVSRDLDWKAGHKNWTTYWPGYIERNSSSNGSSGMNTDLCPSYNLERQQGNKYSPESAPLGDSSVPIHDIEPMLVEEGGMIADEESVYMDCSLSKLLW